MKIPAIENNIHKTYFIQSSKVHFQETLVQFYASKTLYLWQKLLQCVKKLIWKNNATSGSIQKCYHILRIFNTSLFHVKISRIFSRNCSSIFLQMCVCVYEWNICLCLSTGMCVSLSASIHTFHLWFTKKITSQNK